MRPESKSLGEFVGELYFTRPYPILGFTGPKGCGKSTAAAIAASHPQLSKLSKLGMVMSLAGGVREVAYALMPYYGRQFWFKEEDKEVPVDILGCDGRYCHRIAPREGLQDVGNMMRTVLGPDVWVRRLLMEMDRLAFAAGGNTAFFIQDIRFPNEVELLRRCGLFLVYVIRPEAEQSLVDAKREGNRLALDVSEAHYHELLHLADHTIDNSGDRAHLAAGVARVLQVWGAMYDQG